MWQSKILENSGWENEMQKLPQDVYAKTQSLRIGSRNLEKGYIRIHFRALN